jgi:hypothetical protein
VPYDSTPEYNGDTPTRESDAQYTYTFNNAWEPAITKVTENAEYTAVFTSKINEYDVVFKYGKDNEYSETLTLKYGTKLKEESDRISPPYYETPESGYTFNGWVPEITEETEVKGTATYTAQYTSQTRQYNITFIVGDDKVIVPVNYGETPVYPNGKPTKESDAQYTYTFNGWSPEITEVKGDAEYTATFKEEVNKYTITWKNYDGEVLETDKEVPYDSTPEYNGDTPTRESDAQYTYTFNNAWEPAITKVTGNAEYTATFKEEVNKYTVTWKNYDGTELDTDEVSYGDKPEYNGPTPTREGNAQYTYTFNDVWNPEITNETTVTGNTEYTAVFTEKTNEYDITFNYKNENGEDTTSVLTLEYGTKLKEESDKILPPYYETPESGYTFSGWNPEITEETIVEGTATYTAVYSSETREYVVKWFNYDGTPLETDENVPYGTTPTYDGPTPTKKGNEQYTYTFNNVWEPAITTVTGNTEYTAVFTEIPKEYTLDINVENGTYTINPEQETYHYNDEVKIIITPYEGYEYSPLENIITITGDTVLNYTCEAKKYTLTVDGKVYENIPYNSDITPYLTYQPQEGMSHKWMEGNEEFTGNTMPNRDLILTGVYTEVLNDSKTIYYGAVNTNDVNTLSSTDIQELEHYDYVDGIVQDVIFMLPIRPDLWEEYYTYEDEGNTQEMIEWEKRNSYDYFIAAPSNVSVELINAINAVKIIEAHETININGIEYIKYYTDLGLVAEEKYSATIKMKIKIN